jgi:hypothetical protein
VTKERKGAYGILGWKSKGGKISLGKPMRRWNYIKMDMHET